MAFYQLSLIGKDSVQEFENDVILDVCSNIHQYIYTEYIGGFSDAGINRTGLNCIDKIIRPDGPHFSQGFRCLFYTDKAYSADRRIYLCDLRCPHRKKTNIRLAGLEIISGPDDICSGNALNIF